MTETQTAWTVAIVDASRNRFTVLIKLLEEAKIRVEYVSPSEQDIVAKVSALKPDIIIINLFLNGKSTLPTIKELKTNLQNRQSKIIVLTAHNSINNIRESVKVGADDFILEPIDPQLMMQRIRYQLQDREFYSPDQLNKSSGSSADSGAGGEEGFQLVYDSLRVLSEVTSHQEALTTVLSRVAEISKSNRVNLIEGDLETNKGLVAATSDDPNLSDLPIDLDKYPEVREVLLNGNIVYIKDITQNPLTKGIQEQVKTIKIAALLVFPIRHRSQTLGSLNIRLASEAQISDRYLKTFYMIALTLGPKLAARKLLRRHSSPKTAAPATPASEE
jgi:DNA-binding NarL/FixJ family response regulator